MDKERDRQICWEAIFVLSHPYKNKRRAQYLLATELPGHGHVLLFDALAMVVFEPRQVPTGPPNASCMSAY